MKPLPALSVLVGELRRGVRKPTALVDDCLAQIERLDPKLRAWASVNGTAARREAERLERRGPQPQQALWGVPVGIKDIIDVAGFPTGCGSPLASDRPAATDAPIVDRLRVAGAIVLGKTVTTEWACFDPPPTRNPWNLDRTPGGSSSGSAAAVAAEMVPFALGTQTGGSILRPAAFCGIAGLKPGHGALSMQGIAPVSASLDHVGPLARSAADLRWIWNALESETYLLDEYWSDEEDDDENSPAMLAVVEDAFLAAMSPEVRSAFEKSLGLLQRSFDLETYTLPQPMETLHAHHRRIMAVEAAAVHRQAFAATPQKFGPQVRGLIEEGLQVTAVDYLVSREHQQRQTNEVLQQWPDGAVLIMPATLTVAPELSTTGDARFNSPWSYLGLPAATIPCGLSPAGLPIGLQLVGLDERELLSAAVTCERLLGFNTRCPLTAK